jgi:hypothetical protein
MSEDQQELVEEARDSIKAARILLQNLYPGYAAARLLRHVLSRPGVLGG